MASVFAYKLTPVPASLFKENMMRRPDKAVLSNSIAKNAWCTASVEETYHVLDGGALLHRVRWAKRFTYLEIVKHYSSYIDKRYGRNVCVVFDGYVSGPSTKDQEHQRRSFKVAAAVQVSDEAISHSNQALFLANAENKTRFIEYLLKQLKVLHITDVPVLYVYS
jgi:hypothetical protein